MFRTKKDVDKHVRSTLSKLREDEVSKINSSYSKFVANFPEFDCKIIRRSILFVIAIVKVIALLGANVNAIVERIAICMAFGLNFYTKFIQNINF